MANVVWLKDVSIEDTGIVGIKGAKLASLNLNGFNIPYSFIVTLQAFQYMLDQKNLIHDFKEIIEKVDVNDKESLMEASEIMQERILNIEIPDSVKEDIVYAYSHMNIDNDILRMLNRKTLNFLKTGRDFPYMAVRASFNVEGLTGKHVLNVKGKDDLLNAIRNVWSAFFTPKNIMIIKNLNLYDVGVSVIAQRMINPDKFSRVEITENEASINCVYGLGESFSIAVPDEYLMSLSTLELMRKSTNRQDSMFIRDDNYQRTVRKNLNKIDSVKDKLNIDELRKITNYSNSIYNIYHKELTAEIAIENGKLFLIDLNEKPNIDLSSDLEITETINNTNETKSGANSDLFSMFSENAPVTIGNDKTVYQNSDINSPNYQIKPSGTSPNVKVPISFDIKITDSTNIDELKSKLKAIKDFINQEF